MVLRKFKCDVTYDYDDVTHMGHIYDSLGIKTLPVYVFTNVNVSHYSFSVGHRNYVRVIFVDTKNKNLVCDVPGISLRQHVADWLVKEGKQSCFSSYKIPKYGPQQDISLASENLDQYFMYPYIRSLIRDIYVFVHDMHMRGHCLTGLNLSHLCVMNDTLQFFGVGFRRMTGDSMNQDFKWVANVIKELFREQAHANTVIASLIQITQNFSSWARQDRSKGLLLVEHLTIQPPRRVVNFIRACGDYIKDGKSMLCIYQSYKELLDGMTGCNKWNEKFDKSPYLISIRKNMERHRRYKYTAPDSEGKREVKADFIRCARNFVVHFKVGHDLSDEGHVTDPFLKMESLMMFLFKDYFFNLQLSMVNLSYLDFYMNKKYES